MPLPAPIIVDDVFNDPDDVVDAVVTRAPYWNQARYLPKGPKADATTPAGHPLSRPDGSAPPVFRGDWVYGEPLVAGVEELLMHHRLLTASCQLFEAAVAVPYVLHVNLTAPGPAIDAGHTDVPAFLGLDRRQAPGWLLLAMARCGLFDEWSIRSATAVAWLYNGPGGELTYWPEGPDQQPQHHDRLWNTALVGDNDHMFHRVEGVGSPEAPAMMLSATSQLDHVGQRRFDLVDRGEVLTTFDVTELRISLSWKALVFPTEADHDRYVSRRDHLDLDRVLDILGSDLRQRGHPIAHDGGLDDPILMEAVADAYPRRVPSFQSSPGR